MQLIYQLGMEHGELHTDDATVFFFFNKRTGASGETVASWELTVVGFSYTPVFKSNIKHNSNVGPQMHFLPSLCEDFQPPLYVCVNLFPLSNQISAQISVDSC